MYDVHYFSTVLRTVLFSASLCTLDTEQLNKSLSAIYNLRASTIEELLISKSTKTSSVVGTVCHRGTGSNIQNKKMVYGPVVVHHKL